MKKRLLITASTFPRWKGDTEPRFILDYAKAMLPYYDVTVLVPSAPGALKQEILEGVHVLRYRYFPLESLETLCYPGAIVPRIKEKKIRIFLVPFLLCSLYFNMLRISKRYDYIHAHWLVPQGIVGAYIRTPYIVTGHGGDVTSLNNFFMKPLKKRCLKRAAHITAVSQALEAVIYQIYPNDKTSVISMGCNTDDFSKKCYQENLFKQGQCKVILFVGRLAEKKGVSYLIDAMNNIDAKLVIVGKGPLESDLKKKAHDLGDKIIFLGPKTHEELCSIYASADIFAAPSVTASDGDKEGFGLVILEAMASGLPVVANASGGIVDLVKHGENGLLSEERNIQQLADNIKCLLEDKALYTKLANNAYQTAKKYDYANIALRYKDIFESITKC